MVNTCKYCKLNDYGDGEWNNDSQLIEKIRDGSQIFEILLNRYVLESDDNRIAELILELNVETPHGLMSVKDRHIEIKYCPFCGEKF